jgi:phage recombination protein Bet
MNAIVPIPTAPTEEDVLRVLENSLYPGAKPESIKLVLSWCRVNGIDPLLKPVHIVPTSVKRPDGQYEWRDVLMPGIADYRIKAARSGQYAGKSEPEFGPDVTEKLGGVSVTYPQWCRITVFRIVAGQARAFPAKERWLENYATAGRDTEAPNRMWTKRAYGQLAKVAEAQALRMAFPEFSGGYTAEEMEGKHVHDGPTIEHEAEPPKPETDRDRINASVPLHPTPPPERTPAELMDGLEIAVRDAGSQLAFSRLVGQRRVQDMLRDYKGDDLARLQGIVAAGNAAYATVVHPDAETDVWGDAPVTEPAGA